MNTKLNPLGVLIAKYCLDHQLTLEEFSQVVGFHKQSIRKNIKKGHTPSVMFENAVVNWAFKNNPEFLVHMNREVGFPLGNLYLPKKIETDEIQNFLTFATKLVTI